MTRDPYEVLGVRRGATDEQVRTAYRRLVQIHHPDHNNGSAESARRFEEIQDAYAQLRAMRSGGAGGQAGAGRQAGAAGSQARSAASDPDIEARLADLERQLREAQAAKTRARRAAAEAAAATDNRRPSDEELGYVTTDDSFSKILADARAEFSERVAEGTDHSLGQRVADLLDELADKLKSPKSQ